MTTIMMDQSQAEQSEIRRRKVRKGTHSCWECRRRKIRCQFSLDDDTVCIGCRGRGSVCRSQEFINETPVATPERKVAQRLDRLESMMERLMEHVLAKPSNTSSQRPHLRSSSTESHADDDGSPDSETQPPAKENHGSYAEVFPDITEVYSNPSAASARACPTALREHGYETVDVFDTSTAKDTPVAALLGIQNALANTPSSGSVLSHDSMDTSMNGMASGTSPNSSRGSASTGSGRDQTTAATAPAGPNASVSMAHKYRGVSKVLHALFPSQEDINTIAGGAAALFVVSMFHSQHDIAQGRGERPESLTVVPPVTSHPTVLARRLLQITLCMQQIAPCFTLQNKLKMQESLPDTIGRIVSIVAHTVTANDDLIGNLEGIQCLVLMGQQQSNQGHLRKAWLSFRRALSLAQLMGLDHGNTRALKSCDPDHEDPGRRPTPAALWYRINACDRYVSLLLGLRAGTQDGDVGTVAADTDSPVERLGKAHMLLTGRIIERNHSRAPAALPYAVTQAIDADLQAVAGCGLDAAWWEIPSYDPYAPTAFIFGEMSRSILQVNHYCIQILLHLPYMLRHDNGSTSTSTSMAHSRTTCMRASRAVLRRFINFRLIVNTAFSCRHVDYASLIAAMTLIIGYLSPRPPASHDASVHDAFDEQLCQDRAMVEQVRDRMRHIGTSNNDKLSQESAATIDQLLPLLYLVDRKPDATALPAVAPAAAAPCVGACPTESVPDSSAFACGNLDSTKKVAGNPCAASAFAQTPFVPSGVRLNVPYFGTVNIHPNMATQASPCLGSSSQPFGLATPQSTASLAWQGDLSMAGAGATQDGTDFNTMLVDFNTMDDNSGAPFDFEATAAFPDLTGASDDWVMQGVDTTYWTLLNGGGGAFGDMRA